MHMRAESDCAACVQSSWNWDYVTVSGGSATGKASQSWQALTPGYSVNLGAILGTDSSSVDNFKPVSATINGASCSVSSVVG